MSGVGEGSDRAQRLWDEDGAEENGSTSFWAAAGVGPRPISFSSVRYDPCFPGCPATANGGGSKEIHFWRSEVMCTSYRIRLKSFYQHDIVRAQVQVNITLVTVLTAKYHMATAETL